MPQKSQFYFVLLVLCLFSLSACDLLQNQLKPDREGNMEIQDYRDALASRVESDQELAEKNRRSEVP